MAATIPDRAPEQVRPCTTRDPRMWDLGHPRNNEARDLCNHHCPRRFFTECQTSADAADGVIRAGRDCGTPDTEPDTTANLAVLDARPQYRGVSWDRRTHRWVAKLGTGGRRAQVGSFSNEMDAVAAFDRAVVAAGRPDRANLPAAAEHGLAA